MGLAWLEGKAYMHVLWWLRHFLSDEFDSANAKNASSCCENKLFADRLPHLDCKGVRDLREGERVTSMPELLSFVDGYHRA